MKTTIKAIPPFRSAPVLPLRLVARCGFLKAGILPLLLCLMLLTAGAVSGQTPVIFEENFTVPTLNQNKAVNYVGWSAYSGPTATDVSGTVANPAYVAGALGNPNTTPGYLALIPTAGSVAAVRTGLTLNHVATVSWNMNSSSASGVRLLIQIGGNWYASSNVYVPSFSGTFSTGTPAQVGISTTFTTTASAWRSFTLAPGGAMTLGAALTSDLPSNATITGIGFYDATATVTRLETLQVTQAPVIFEEDFTAPLNTNKAVNYVGWSAYSGATATDVSSLVANPAFLGGALGNPSTTPG